MLNRNCPNCKSTNYLERIPKRGLSRLFGRFIEVHHHRCENFTCNWEGLIFPSFKEKSLTQVLLPYAIAIGFGIAGLGGYYLLSIARKTNQDIKKLVPTANIKYR